MVDDSLSAEHAALIEEHKPLERDQHELEGARTISLLTSGTANT